MMGKLQQFILTILIGVLLAEVAAPVAAATSDGWVIDWWAISAGGMAASAERCTLSGIIAQPLAGQVDGGSAQLYVGFYALLRNPAVDRGPTICLPLVMAQTITESTDSQPVTIPRTLPFVAAERDMQPQSGADSVNGASLFLPVVLTN